MTADLYIFEEANRSIMALRVKLLHFKWLPFWQRNVLVLIAVML